MHSDKEVMTGLFEAVIIYLATERWKGRRLKKNWGCEMKVDREYQEGGSMSKDWGRNMLDPV